MAALRQRTNAYRRPTLSSLRGKQNVVLVFYRGYWCPYCITQFQELRALLDADLEKDTA